MTLLFLHRLYAFVLSLSSYLSRMALSTLKSLEYLLRHVARRAGKLLLYSAAIFVFLGYLILRIFKRLIYRKELSSPQPSRVATTTTTNSVDTETSTTAAMPKETSPQEWKMDLPYDPHRVKRVPKKKP